MLGLQPEFSWKNATIMAKAAATAYNDLIKTVHKYFVIKMVNMLVLHLEVQNQQHGQILKQI